jgi:hypothetical protein
MDLHDIVLKTQLPLRKLRYVLDQGILPDTKVETDSQRWGHPRSFTEFQAFCIAVAAALLEGGLRRDLVGQFFGTLTRSKFSKFGRRGREEEPLVSAFQPRVNPCRAEIRDGEFLSLTLGNRVISWIDLKSSSLIHRDNSPLVVVTCPQE